MFKRLRFLCVGSPRASQCYRNKWPEVNSCKASRRAFENYHRLFTSMTLDICHSNRTSRAIDNMNEALSAEQASDYKKAFMMFDSDKDGVISLCELRIVLKTLGEKATEKELKKITKDHDAYGNGFVELKSFLELMSEKENYRIALANEVKQAFSYFDIDGDGFISLQELKQVALTLGEELTEEEVDEMIREADSDGDGLVDFDEFMRVMTFDPELE